MASFTQRMMGAALLDVKTYEEVEADKTATGQAMTVVILSSVAAGIGAISLGLDMLLWMTLAALVGWCVWAGLTYVIGTKLLPEPQTQSDMGELLRTIGFSTAPGVLRVLGFIPFLGALISFAAGVWMLVAMVIAVRQALDYKSTGRAVGVCLIGFVIYMVVLGGLGAMVMGGSAISETMF
jgi:hypothetical protein